MNNIPMQSQAPMSQRAANAFSNPLIRKLGKVQKRAAAGQSASYGGITAKTAFFLLATIGGLVLYYVLDLLYFSTLPQMEVVTDGITYYFSGTELIFLCVALLLTILTPIFAFLIRPTIPVTGTLYSVSQGFVLAWIIDILLVGYEWIAWAALGITIILVALMAVLYTARIIKVGKKFRAVLTVLFLTMIISSLACLVCYFIPATSGFVTLIVDNPIISTVSAVFGIIVATLFLLSDFDAIERTVNNALPKKYEWLAAFALAFTVIWIYLKVLDLLVQVTDRS